MERLPAPCSITTTSIVVIDDCTSHENLAFVRHESSGINTKPIRYIVQEADCIVPDDRRGVFIRCFAGVVLAAVEIPRDVKVCIVSRMMSTRKDDMAN
jgi:hypothetical protein